MSLREDRGLGGESKRRKRERKRKMYTTPRAHMQKQIQRNLLKKRKKRKKNVHAKDLMAESIFSDTFLP